ncbi:SDR family NAD(P)-dependent oxidoreductase [Palleronia caenipelagi]|uniref:SDR family NAD(P)-dependent oxidoreductase n=1 Tax=Palleronia caenipelagi TaxID=2489174 RepID=A0A547QAR7_9RHOB|nr:SDR family NAD(P)-dependent oxidoreductase [Palleronia caenipelagi]TRD23487.1 SDR family NAD(P)-dependent oxidoreductase [Palleronia caenipelagi]
MKRALVIGATGGVGRAVVAELQTRGLDVVSLSRADGFDITDEDSVVAGLANVPDPLDLVFVATGALASTRDAPEKSLADFGADEVIEQVRLNALGPALVLKHLRPRIPRAERFVFACLSARVGSIGDNRLGGWYSYRTSKAALNALIHGAAVEIARTRKQAILTCLHPGTVETRFTLNYPDHAKVTPQTAARNLLNVIEGLTPADSGRFFDYAGKEIPW